MSSPDLEIRLNQPPEFPQLYGEYAQKDIFSPYQFDEKSREKLFATAQNLKASFRTEKTRSILRGNVFVASYEQCGILTWYSFDTAISELGANQPLHQKFPDPTEPNFEDEMIDMKTASPDAVLLYHPNPRVLLRAVRALKSVPSSIPTINIGVFNNINYAKDSRWREYDNPPEDLPLKMALLTLVLEKA